MRFRLANLQPQQPSVSGIGDGIASAMNSYFQAPLLAAQAADERRKADADMAYRAAQQRQADAGAEQSRAHAALFGQQQQDLATQAQRGSVGELLKTAANMHGISPAEAPDFASYAQTGQMPGRYEAPVDGVGPVQPTPGYYTDGTAKKLFQTLGLMQQALTVGDKSTENIAKATGMYRDQALGDAVLAGQRPAGLVGQAQAAMKGQKLFDNIGDTGSGYNLFTGDKQVLDPGLVAIFGDKAAAQIGRENAAAGASKASAAHSFASAAKVNQDRIMGEKGVLQQTDQGLLLVNPRDGTARPVMGPGGQPAGRPGVAKMTEDQGKATGWLIQATNAFGNMQKAMESTPSSAKPGFPDAVAALPWGIGEAPANMMRSADRQKFMQGASSLSEALLRAATGAGVNRDEALQKIREITPVFGERPETTKQKMEAIPLYIESLKVRAGPGAPLAAGVLPASGGATGSWGPSTPGRTVNVDY